MLGISVIKNAKSLKGEMIVITSRDMKGDNLKELRKSLKNKDWINIFVGKEGVDDQFEIFHKMLMSDLDKFCPEKTISVPSKQIKREPWLTKGLINCYKKQRLLYQLFLKDRTEIKERKYKVYQNTLQRITRKEKQKYYNNQCITFKSNSKRLWQLINRISNKKNDKSCLIDYLKINNIENEDPTAICNEFGKYFSNVGSSYAAKIPESKKSIANYLSNMTRNPKSVFLTPCTETEIAKLIDKLPNKKSSGYDGVSNALLKELKKEVIKPLTYLFNNSLQAGVFPSLMKHAEVVPLYKSGLTNLTVNYRPISLLITISKLLEKVLYSRTYNFLNDSQIYSSQYGFRKNHSCENAISELIGLIVKGWERKQSTIAIFLDLSKAFDTLEHTVLYSKLENYGIRGTALNWFQSYLTDRTMSVKCKTKQSGTNCWSNSYPVSYGTPQGSCLGPLLFLIFCNDIYKIMEFCNCILFADDTTIYKTHSDSRFLEWSVNEDLKLVADWFKANKLTLNLKKTVCMFFDHRMKSAAKININIDGETIPQVSNTKFLGIFIDDKLKWKKQLDHLIRKIKCNTKLLQLNCNFVSKHVKKILYYSQIFSHISYGIGIWGNHISKQQIETLQKLQNKCIRLICKKKYITKYDFTDLGVLRVNEIIKLENLKFAYKLKKNLLPIKIKECTMHDHRGKSLEKTHHYSTRAKGIPNATKATNKHYLNSIFCKSNKAFRTLKGKTQDAVNLFCFVKECKHLIMKGQY